MNSLTKQSKQTRLLSFSRIKLILFFIGCAIGAACFVYIYGYRIMIPTYDGWMFNGDMDLRQHYIGWCHYRMSDWHFPIGLIDTLSYPTSVSVIYTDSIPVFAVVFKLFRNILPVHFQYYGIFGFLSFCLQGGISVLLIYHFISEYRQTGGYNSASDSGIRFINMYIAEIYSCITSIFFILSFTVLQRMFYHTALGAQWIILLALYIWFEKNNMSWSNKMIIYALMGVLAIFVHSYFLPMIGMILLCACVDKCILAKRSNSDLRKEICLSFVALFIYCVAALISLWVLGGFYGESRAFGEGLGTFSSNLNTFINPLDDSAIFKRMPLYYDFQYEGFGYVGAGIMVMVLIVAVHMMKSFGSIKDIKLKLCERYRILIGAGLFVVGCMLAMFPIVAFGSIKLFGVPYPMFIRRILGIFRSNGRFIWIPMYLIILGAIVSLYRILKNRLGDKNRGKSMLLKCIIVLLLLQIVDVSYMVSYKQDYFRANQIATNVWDDSIVRDAYGKYKEFAFLYNENDVMMDTGFYAYLNNMCMNSYYYARSYDEEINKDIAQWRHELSNGIVEDYIVYVAKKDDPDISTYDGLYWYDLDDNHVYGVKK